MVDFNKLYKGSYYTITGAGGDLNTWMEGYQDLLDEEKIGKIKEWITFSGKEMNNFYNLKGNNAYPSNLTFLAFPLDGLNIGKLAIFKIKMQDRWFDDIVDNNAIRQENEEMRGHRITAKKYKKHKKCNNFICNLENSARRMI